MSDVKRYDLLGEYSDTHIGEFLDGDYVRFADYETLRAELTEARRQLKEAREQKPVAYCFASEIAQFNDEQFRIAQMHNRKCSNAEIALYTRAHVPQPAVPEAAEKDALRERLAELAHEQWAGWMEYLFSKGDFTSAGTWVMPAWAVDRWQRQRKTLYAYLSHAEKESDRKEADKFLAAILSATDSEVKKDE